MPDGSMRWNLGMRPCAGFEKYPTITFSYDFQDFTDKDGTYITGTGRQSFLPATDEGICVFEMFVEGWKRRVNMRVGDS